MRKRIQLLYFVIFLVIFPCLSLPDYTQAASFSRRFDRPGPYTVRTHECLDLVDEKRQSRPVPLRIYFPAEQEQYPLIVMSHGGGGNTLSMEYQAKHMASYGYVVACPEHVFSNSQRLKYFMRKEGGDLSFVKALHAVTVDARSVLGRPKDIRFVIDQMLVLARSDGPLKDKINARKIGMMGHSFGAYTTMVICGAQPVLDYLEPASGTGLAGDLSDDRVAFGFAMSPQSPKTVYFNEKSYQTIDRPLVCLTGSRDVQKSFDGERMKPQARWEVLRLLPEGEKHFVWLKNADHLSFADNRSTKFLPSLSRGDVQRITRSLMVIFSEYYLKDDLSMHAYMNEAYVNSLRGLVVRKVLWFEK